MYSQFLSADADGFLGSAAIQVEDLAGLTLRTEVNWEASDGWDEDEDQEEGWDEEGEDEWDEDDWEDEDLEDEDDVDDEGWDDEDDDWEG
jgi:hypothetical protein